MKSRENIPVKKHDVRVCIHAFNLAAILWGLLAFKKCTNNFQINLGSLGDLDDVFGWMMYSAQFLVYYGLEGFFCLFVFVPTYLCSIFGKSANTWDLMNIKRHSYDPCTQTGGSRQRPCQVQYMFVFTCAFCVCAFRSICAKLYIKKRTGCVQWLDDCY